MASILYGRVSMMDFDGFKLYLRKNHNINSKDHICQGKRGVYLFHFCTDANSFSHCTLVHIFNSQICSFFM